MLIKCQEINDFLLSKNININGIFHIGAHQCEEMGFYNKLGIKKEDIVWIDAIPANVAAVTNRGIPNVYTAVITDKDDEEIVFNISNNVQSSSVLELGTHLQEHPDIIFIKAVAPEEP